MRPSLRRPRIFPVVLLGLAIAAVPVLSLGSSAGAAATRPAGQPRACSFSASPYSEPRSVLSECGYKLYPVRSIHALPGGGKAYVYDEDGLKLVEPVPPKGFNPLTASARRLREYGLPVPNRTGRRAWLRAMRVWHPPTPPRTLIAGGPLRGSIIDEMSSNWAGWLDTGHSDYNYASANYTEPSISDSSCPAPLSEFTWVGLGGASSTSSLAQAGTAYGDGHPHGAFQELSTADNSYPPTWSTWDASAGDPMYTEVTWDQAKASNYEYFVEDDSNGNSYVIIAYSASYTGTTADFITEAPSDGPDAGDYTNLSNFGSIPFTGAIAGRGTSTTTTHNLDYFDEIDNLTMTNGSTTLAFSPEIYGDGSDFTIKQSNCLTS